MNSDNLGPRQLIYPREDMVENCLQKMNPFLCHITVSGSNEDPLANLMIWNTTRLVEEHFSYVDYLDL